MKTCLACETKLENFSAKIGYCHDCIKEFGELQSLCMNCSSPLQSSSPRCTKCGHRHGMASCSCCGEALFKHSAAAITHSQWRELPQHGTGIGRLFRWIGQPKKTELLYSHPQCLDDLSAHYPGALKISDIDFKYLQFGQENPERGSGVTQTQDTHPSLSELASHATNISVNQANTSKAAVLETSVDSLSDEWLSSWLSPVEEDISQLVQRYQDGERQFTNKEMKGVTLVSQTLVGLSLNQSDLSRSNLKDCNLSESDLTETIADFAKFNGCTITGSLLRNTSLRDCKIILSDFYKSDFYQADLRRTDFYSSTLKRATLTLANLTDAKLDGVDLSLACCLLTNFSNASLMESILDGGNFEQANLSGANLTWASLKEVIASKADFRNSILQHCDLTKVDLREANLKGTDFLNSNLNEALSLENASYNDLTRFPTEFEPESWGMLKCSD